MASGFSRKNGEADDFRLKAEATGLRRDEPGCADEFTAGLKAGRYKYAVTR